MKICKNCYKRKTLRFNLLKRENAPRIYHIECGLCPDKDYESDCVYFEEKGLKRIFKTIKNRIFGGESLRQQK